MPALVRIVDAPGGEAPGVFSRKQSMRIHVFVTLVGDVSSARVCAGCWLHSECSELMLSPIQEVLP